MDFTHAKSSVNTVHLVHPKPQSAKDIFEIFGKELDLPLIPYTDWVKRLEGCSDEQSADAVPGLKLLDFFRTGLETESQGYEVGGVPILACEAGVKSSAHLQQAKRIGPSEVVGWLDYWKSIDFLPSSKAAL